jgi:HlyD family secretion protein
MATKITFRPVLVTAVALVVMILIWHWRSSGVAYPDPAPLVRVITVTPQSLPTKLVVAGTVQPAVQVDLGAREAGTLASVAVDIGAHVVAGQTLASFDTSQLAPAVAAAQAQLLVAQATGTATAQAYDRVAGLGGTGAIAPEQVDQRGADAAAQRAQIQVARANLAAAQAQLANATVTAPMAGVIALRNAEPGQLAAPGGPPLFRLIGDQGLIFRATIPQDQVALIAPGMTVDLALPSGTAHGHVIGADPEIDPLTHLGSLRAALEPNPGLLPGAFIEAAIRLGSQMQLAVPQTALVADADGFHVVLVNHGIAEFQPVTLATVPGNASGLVPIASGINSGDTIVMENGASLRDGQTVRPAN